MNKYIFYILLLSLHLLNGQVNTTSSYSYLGIGDLNPVGNNYNIAMGGLGGSLSSNKYLNHINPATYSFLDRTSFEFGMRSKFINMSQNNLQQSNFVSGLTSIGLGFPISSKLSVSAALLPYSSVGYKFSQLDTVTNATTNFEGSGGINKFLIGTSMRILDNFSIGANFNYLFGQISREEHLYTTYMGSHFRSISEIMMRGITFDVGLLYFTWIDNYKISIGASIQPGRDIDTEINTVKYLLEEEIYNPYNESNIVLTPTNNQINYQTHLPVQSTFGFSIQNEDKWLLGVDYRYTDWSNYTENGLAVCCMKNNNEFIFGGFFIPKKEDIYNYFNRVEYRFGLSYSVGYLGLNDNNNQTSSLNHMSGTFGLGLPINRVASKANIAFKYGIINPGLIADDLQEQYFSIYLSMTLNEKWFQKLKIQ